MGKKIDILFLFGFLFLAIFSLITILNNNSNQIKNIDENVSIQFRKINNDTYNILMYENNELFIYKNCEIIYIYENKTISENNFSFNKDGFKLKFNENDFDIVVKNCDNFNGFKSIENILI